MRNPGSFGPKLEPSDGQISRVTLLKFWRYGLPLSAPFGAVFAFVTAAPFLIIERFGIATQHYGLWIGVTMLA